MEYAVNYYSVVSDDVLNFSIITSTFFFFPQKSYMAGTIAEI